MGKSIKREEFCVNSKESFSFVSFFLFKKMQQKRTVLTQELIRRLLRTKKELSCKVKHKILTSFMQI